MSEQNPNILWLALASLPGRGSVAIRRQYYRWGSIEETWERTAISPEERQQAINIASQQYKLLRHHGVIMLNLQDSDFPSKELDHPDLPTILFAKGCLERLRDPIVAVVGSRKSTNYGSEATQKLVSQLVARGMTIASGLASGIDSIAHQSTIPSGKTIAVLGYSHEYISVANKQLVQQILSHSGLLLSPFPPGTPPQRYTFPVRNRLLAAISQAVVVTQADRKSGSLLTANAASDYGKKVFAIPGSIFDFGSSGPHALIQGGASLAIDAADIVQSLPSATAALPSGNMPLPTTALSAAEETILQHLQSEPMHIDQLIRASSLAPAEALATVSLLELKQMIRPMGDGVYRRQ